MKTSTTFGQRFGQAVSVDTVETFPFDILQYVRPCKNRNGRPGSYDKKYADIIATFDIETTALDDIKQSVLWHWQACIDGLICVGRTWEEYKEFLVQVDKYLPKGLTFLQWCHNLSYEWQFLRSIYDFQPDEVFCLTGRKIAKADMGARFEYRCSYVLTNMSLREFLKKMGVEHQKTELDYRKIRYPWTPVDSDELAYCIADVLGLYEALRKNFKADGLRLSEVPLTSTGYVRKDFKHNMRAGGFIPEVRECAPSYEVYLMIRRAFRGGNTHANRYYTGVIMDDVKSYDRASSYPDVLVNYPYPVRPWEKQYISRLDQLEEGFPYLIEIEFEKLEQSDPFYGCPYLAVHKCYDLVNSINDNGRVLQCDHSVIYCTDIDLQIIIEQYKWKSAKILQCYRSEYGMLPQAVIDTTMDYYRRKTELKGVEGQEIYYGKAKALLNSIYGMMATNPVRTQIQFNGVDFSVKDCDEREELKKANSRSFVEYAWGCWCTAYARLALEKAIRICGYKFIYCDTDSVKYVGDVDMSGLNRELQALSEKHKAYADDPAGHRHYLGVFEYEGRKDDTGRYLPTYKRYCTLGAKKYAYEDENGKLHITIAGVEKGGARELGSLERFADAINNPFVFKESAGVEAVYNDLGHDPITVDGHRLEIPPNIYLYQSEYTLGAAIEYKKLFWLSQEEFDRIMKLR